MGQLQAIRSGKWKLHLPLENKIRNGGEGLGKVNFILYDLNLDIKEKTDISLQYPEVVKRLLSFAEKAREDIGDLERKGKHQRNAATVINPQPLFFRNKSN